MSPNRTRTRTTRAAACAALLAVAGCYGDQFSTRDPPGSEGGGDPGGGDPGSGPDAAPIPDGLDLTCADPQNVSDDGHHRAGQACGACHNGSIAPTFTVGGTLFADPDGAAPVAGATVTLLDADGNRLDLVTASNGNFWTDRSVAYPVTTYASSCPDVAPMSTQAGSGDCNDCHTAGDAITFAP